MPIRFALLERAAFEALTEAVEFRVAALAGDHHGSPYREGESPYMKSPYMIWTLERDGVRLERALEPGDQDAAVRP